MLTVIAAPESKLQYTVPCRKPGSSTVKSVKLEVASFIFAT